jgi:adenosylhomocysteine nucleosidase
MTINAAVATHIAIEKYNPIAIINEGTAGGHGRNVHKGDIVIGKKCINILSSQIPFKKENEGSNSLDWELVNFISGEENRLIYQKADENLVRIAKQVEFPSRKSACWNSW